jgi:hypothetical protein
MILTLVSVGDGYSNKPEIIEHQAKRFIDTNWDVRILTDNPENFKFAKTQKYQNKIFSYFDKILFPLRIMEETKSGVLYIDHDFMHNISDDFINNFNGTNYFIYFENWKKWDDNLKSWDQWKYFGDFYLDYYEPLIKSWGKENYDYKNILTIRECFMYIPYLENVQKVIYELEKIKPVFEYMSVIGENKFTGYGQSEGLALFKILMSENLKFKLYFDFLADGLK